MTSVQLLPILLVTRLASYPCHSDLFLVIYIAAVSHDASSGDSPSFPSGSYQHSSRAIVTHILHVFDSPSSPVYGYMSDDGHPFLGVGLSPGAPSFVGTLLHADALVIASDHPPVTLDGNATSSPCSCAPPVDGTAPAVGTTPLLSVARPLLCI